MNLTLDKILPANSGGIDDIQFSNVQSARIYLAAIEVDPILPDAKIISKDDDESTEFKYDQLLDTEVSVLILPNEFFIWMSSESRVQFARHAFLIAQKVIE